MQRFFLTILTLHRKIGGNFYFTSDIPTINCYLLFFFFYGFIVINYITFIRSAVGILLVALARYFLMLLITHNLFFKIFKVQP